METSAISTKNCFGKRFEAGEPVCKECTERLGCKQAFISNFSRICYVCGKKGLGFIQVGKDLYRCSDEMCTFKVIHGVSRVYIDSSIIPPEGITSEWKKTITQKDVPFIGVDRNTGKFVITDSKIPLEPDNRAAPIKENKVPYVSKFDILLKILLEGKKTMAELRLAIDSPLQSVHSQFYIMKKKGYEVIKTFDSHKNEDVYSVEEKEENLS